MLGASVESFDDMLVAYAPGLPPEDLASWRRVPCTICTDSVSFCCLQATS